MNFAKAVGISLFAIFLLALWQIRWLLLLLFTAIVLAIALNMLANWLQRWLLKRGYAVLAAILIFTIGLAAFLGTVVPPLVVQFEELGQLLPRGIAALSLRYQRLAAQLDPKLIQSLPDLSQFFAQLQPIFNEIAGRGLKFFYGSLGILLSLLLLFALTVMLLVNPRPYRQGFIRFFPAFYRRRTADILNLCDIALQGWLAGILYNMAIVSLLCWLGLTLLGIPLALVQAAIAGLLTFIPSLGLALSAIPPLAISLLEEPWKPLGVLLLYLGIQQVESHFLLPRITTPSIDLLPAITLLAQIFFAISFGFLGLLLALPLTIVAQIWFREVVVKDVLDRWEIRDDK